MHAERITPINVFLEQELIKAGVHCEADTFQVLEDEGVVTRIGSEYELSKPARKILNTFTVANGPQASVDIRVDYPEVFIVMPFGRGQTPCTQNF